LFFKRIKKNGLFFLILKRIKDVFFFCSFVAMAKQYNITLSKILDCIPETSDQPIIPETSDQSIIPATFGKNSIISNFNKDTFIIASQYAILNVPMDTTREYLFMSSITKNNMSALLASIACYEGPFQLSENETLAYSLKPSAVTVTKFKNNQTIEWQVILTCKGKTPFKKFTFNKAGTLIAALDETDTVVIWDISRCHILSGNTTPISILKKSQKIFNMCFIQPTTLALCHPMGHVGIIPINSMFDPSRLFNSSSKGNILRVISSPDEKYFATLEQDNLEDPIKIWSSVIDGFVERQSHRKDDSLTRKGKGDIPIYNIAFNPDGTMIASIRVGGTFDLWDIKMSENTAVGSLERKEADAYSIAFTFDGNQLVCHNITGEVEIFNINQF